MLRTIIEYVRPIDWIEGLIGLGIGLFGVYTAHQGILLAQKYNTFWFALLMFVGLALVMYATTWLIGDGKFNKVGRFLQRNRNRR